jgi:hypothetical protein
MGKWYRGASLLLLTVETCQIIGQPMCSPIDRERHPSVFKIEVFNAFQMQFGPSKHTSLKTTLQIIATPTWKRRRRHSKSSIRSARHKNQQAQGIVTTRSGVRWLTLNSSHHRWITYDIIHAQMSNTSFVCHFYILGLMSWIWTNPSVDGLKFWGALENETHTRAFDLEHWHPWPCPSLPTP